MEDQEHDPTPHYTQAFNNGYLLAKYDPEFTKQLIAQDNSHDDYFNGIVAGKKQYDTEMEQELLNRFSRSKTPPSRDRDLER